MSTDQSTLPSATGPAAVPAVFAADLADAVALLRGLPTAQDRVDDAHRSVRDWGAQRPWLRVQLAVDDPPGTTRVGYDLLLEHPEGGTVALSAEVDDGIPWLVDHSTHWAAANILSVDGVGLSIAAALSAIRSLGTRDPRIHEQLVDHRILLNEMENDPRPPTDAETRQAADEFRRRRGLTTRAQTLDWLAKTGMSEEALWGHAKIQARITRIRERFAGDPARRYLAEHPEEFTMRRAVWVTGARPETLAALLDGPVTEFANRVTAALLPMVGADHPTVPGGKGRGVRLQATATLTPHLPEPLQTVSAGTAIGPVPHDGGHLAGVVYEVVPPDPEAPEVLNAARDAAFQAWLDERRRAADIRWFWL
ncbi:putative peptide maturation system protein [Streptosporangium becharense]|uniref:Putative peptide maturation system protein n=1 Tax=Streptosporangium becharense TaxID=1816182 RepID=A0A7W9MGI1_9ACTN|nr:TIGR04500 family putative peptide maturation system protein [Streptosporangium becharense]MBB2908845.1 putative peptide maturation system protein [Streptosporangium becharense]MBB5820137.1 putative peptide maturation system protein [Streptosporangium becharense]